MSRLARLASRLTMWHVFYNVALLLGSPIILLILLAKRRCRRGLPERLGLTNGPLGVSGLHDPNRPVVWVHAVSLGEVVAVVPLVKELKRRHPGCRFVLSTVTETGREAAEERLAGVAEHFYAPLDFSWVVSRTVARLRPVLYVFVETELWPNLLRCLARSGVPTVMVNGRLSTRSFARQQWGPVRAFYRTMVRSLSLCLMQSDRDVERMVSLGAEAGRVRRTGNIKFDQPLPAASGSGAMRDRLGLREDEWLIVAGSTHAGEEEILADCYRTIARRHPAVRLLLAPRHIERADSVEAMLRSKGLAVRRRNRLDQTGRTTGDEPEVILLDTRGELASMYQEAIVAFVGGTLVPVGGHNLLEPAAWAKPVLFGPYTDHCAEIAGLLVQSGGGRRVAGAEALTRELLRLLEQPEEREAAGLRARAVVEQNQGAIQSTADAIDRVLALTYSDTSPVWSRDPVPLAAGR